MVRILRLGLVSKCRRYLLSSSFSALIWGGVRSTRLTLSGVGEAPLQFDISLVRRSVAKERYIQWDMGLRVISINLMVDTIERHSSPEEEDKLQSTEKAQKGEDFFCVCVAKKRLR